MPKIQIATIGHITIDDVIYHTGETFFNQLGGCSLYSAIGAWFWKRQGVAIVSRKGRNIPDEVVETFAEKGIDTRYIRQEERYNSPQSWQIFDRFSNRYTVTNPESGPREIVTPDQRDFEGEVLEAEGFHLAPLCPLSIVEEILNKIPESAVKTLDAQPAWCAPEYLEKLGTIFPKVTVFMPSEGELVKLFGIDCDEDWHGYLPYLKKLYELGAGRTVLKMGEKGSLVYDGEGETCWKVGIARNDCINAMGAGDMFCGGFLANYVDSGDLLDSSIRATVSSSFKIERRLMKECLDVTEKDVQDRLAEIKSYIDIEKIII